jgi:predicted DNA-binding transcriptional regulator AlpA
LQELSKVKTEDLTIKQLATELGFSPNVAWAKVKNGLFPGAYRIGPGQRPWRIPPPAVAAYNAIQASDQWSIKQLMPELNLSRIPVWRMVIAGVFPGAYRRPDAHNNPWRVPNADVLAYQARRRGEVLGG